MGTSVGATSWTSSGKWCALIRLKVIFARGFPERLPHTTDQRLAHPSMTDPRK